MLTILFVLTSEILFRKVQFRQNFSRIFLEEIFKEVGFYLDGVLNEKLQNPIVFHQNPKKKLIPSY